MDMDDRLVGRVISRRRALALCGAPALLWLARCGSAADANEDPNEPVGGACVVRPELTEGPYYVDENLNRSDIRSDSATGAVRPGTPLLLSFHVSRISGNGCTPLSKAVVDVWHADAGGDYSDVGSLRGQDFLRGLQITDANGRAGFTTIYPGWYSGRAVHIHFKVRSSASSGSNYEFTSQLFFDDGLSRQVYQQSPYATRGQQHTTNAQDGIYRQAGSQLLLNATRTATGYAASFDIALDV